MKWRHVRQKKSSPTVSIQPNRPLYGGFWARVLAFITDLFMIGLPVSLLFMLLFGHDQMKSAGAIDLIVAQGAPLSNAPDPLLSLAQMLVSMLIYVAFWRLAQQTPGKKMLHLCVVDARTLKRASWLQLSLRFIGYIFSALPLFAGFLLPLLRKDRRSLHDLISRTAVIYNPRS
ncbi:MAG: RDD family protein [Campylobacterales bacterium]|nr:RDD family protein [Campylobacterales bacterium]